MAIRHVIHHHDLDGFCAAWVFHKKYPDAIFYSVDHPGNVPNIIDDSTPYSRSEQAMDELYIVDITFDREQTEKWESIFGKMQVLDHHKSAQEVLGDLPYCHFDMTKCGASLAWEYCFPNEEPHWLVRYTEDLDLWRWKLPNSNYIIPAICSYRFDFKIWDNILSKKTLEGLVEEGKVIAAYEDTLIEDHLKRAKVETFKGYENVPVVYCDLPAIRSELGHSLLRGHEHTAPFAVTWRIKGGSKVYSLRSSDRHRDVSKIAGEFGGGGHRNAAGFSEPFKE